MAREELADGRSPQPDLALPRLAMKHLGMHIGGEDNSPLAKRPWLSDIEAHSAPLLACYRWVAEPEAGGSVGVDLYVSRSGGAAEVRAMRQKLGGTAFEDCMRGAWASVPFHAPERPTVLSYSLLFELEDVEH